VFIQAVAPDQLADHHAILGRVLHLLHLHGFARIGVVGKAKGADPVETAVLQDLHDLIANEDETLHQAVACRPRLAGVEGPIEIVEDFDVTAVDGFPFELKLARGRPLLPRQGGADVLRGRSEFLLEFKKLSAESLIFGAEGVISLHGLLQLSLGQAGPGLILPG